MSITTILIYLYEIINNLINIHFYFFIIKGNYISYIITMPIHVRDRNEYFRTYSKKPEVMTRNNEASKRRSKEKKRENTKKRIQEHTMLELMLIVKETCREKGVDYESVKGQYNEFMKFLHDVSESEN